MHGEQKVLQSLRGREWWVGIRQTAQKIYLSKLTNLFPLKSLENHRFSDYYRGDFRILKISGI